jgi:hypothetical protein
VQYVNGDSKTRYAAVTVAFLPTKGEVRVSAVSLGGLRKGMENEIVLVGVGGGW